MEYHPRIDINNPLISNSKIILGSFPIWSLTNHEEENYSLSKINYNIQKDEMPFFYGSSNNNFWDWYKLFIDSSISTKNVEAIKKSLVTNNIGITDVIYSCVRKEKSSLDKHLTKRTYNHLFFNYPSQNQKLKILCSSKGVMNEMLLNKHFFKVHPDLDIDNSLSIFAQNEILKQINGNPKKIKQPFLSIINCKNGGIIECLSTPSPGSPFRKLSDFGIDAENNKAYLSGYLKMAFDWFKN